MLTLKLRVPNNLRWTSGRSKAVKL